MCSFHRDMKGIKHFMVDDIFMLGFSGEKTSSTKVALKMTNQIVLLRHKKSITSNFPHFALL